MLASAGSICNVCRGFGVRPYKERRRESQRDKEREVRVCVCPKVWVTNNT